MSWEKLMQITADNFITRIEDLEPEMQEQVNAIIALSQGTNQRQSDFPAGGQGAEVYAYPMGEITAWGVNAPGSGRCFARGVI